MAQITIEKETDTRFIVKVEAQTSTTHTVTLSDEYYQKLAAEKATRERLIEESFRFLLERESNSSILRSFDLPVTSSSRVSRYAGQAEMQEPQYVQRRAVCFSRLLPSNSSFAGRFQRYSRGGSSSLARSPRTGAETRAASSSVL